ncbi:MAG: transglycosylase domain-containing protein [Bacteroidota bacterium]
MDKRIPNYYLKVIRRLWMAFAIALLSIPSYILTVRFNLLNLYGGLPPIAMLQNPKQDLSSELYSADGVLLGKYFRHNRSPVVYEEISQNMINALLATEDYRFARHSGIDLKALYRAFFVSVLLRKRKGGGSTISQQLAKNLFKTRSKRYQGWLSGVPLLGTLIFKTKEWIVAVQLEYAYTKQEILTMYLNTVSFGSNAFGIKVAAKTFFNTTPSLLTAEQAALLVGLLKAPSYYSPLKHPERARQRRNLVLTQMHKYQLLSAEEYIRIKEYPIDLAYEVEDHNVGIATYFRSTIRDFLLRWTRERGYDLFEDGLKIYTTIDSRLQQHAEAAVAAHMPTLQKKFEEHWEGANPWADQHGKELPNFIENVAKHTPLYKKLKEKYGEDQAAIDEVMNTPVPTRLFTWQGEIEAVVSPIEAIKHNKRLLHTGFIAMNPYTGHIKAWVGGINYNHFQYDHVMQGKRQAGSAFKPIVYAVAIDNGYTPWQEVVDTPITFQIPGGTWTPQNWHKRYTGQRMTLRQAMARSVNSVTAYLTKQLGPELIVAYAKNLGIKSPIDAVPSVCLGVADLSVCELVGAYSTFMNKGVWTEPCYIMRIEDKNGQLLQKFIPTKREAVSEITAYLMMHMLKGTLEEIGGGASRIKKILKEGNEICGKTGTTSNQSDAWFVGLVKNLCAGVWVGGENRCIHFRTIGLGGGAWAARPIWEDFIQRIYEDPELLYAKGPLLNHPQPEGISIPGTHKEDSPAPEGSLEEREEEKSMEVEIDVKDIL